LDVSVTCGAKDRGEGEAVRDLLEGSVRPRLQRDDGACQPQLTPTQTRVFRFVHAGLSNKEIARELGIAEATVKIHMTALMRRLNVRNRTQVAIVASGFCSSRAVAGETNTQSISANQIDVAGGNSREIHLDS
jgi:DNA-binding CsgD family transcriptional regulator